MIKVLSLFDGIGGAAQALKELGIDSFYIASEIDKYAMQIARKNHSDIIHLGDVNQINFNLFFWRGGAKLDQNYNTVARWKSANNIDLLIAGFPCQSFSGAGKQKSFEDERGQLFFKCVEALKTCKPKYFLFENVASMKQEDQDFISHQLGVKPIMINSNLLTAQNRKRLYWTNIKVEQPTDAKIYLKDILQDLPDCPIGIKVREKANGLRVGGRNSPFGAKQIWDSPFQCINKNANLKLGIEKASCLSGGANSGGNHSDMDLIHSTAATRRYSTIECERLQGFPDNYTEGVSNSQRYKALGNSFTVSVIKHILKNIN